MTSTKEKSYFRGTCDGASVTLVLRTTLRSFYQGTASKHLTFNLPLLHRVRLTAVGSETNLSRREPLISVHEAGRDIPACTSATATWKPIVSVLIRVQGARTEELINNAFSMNADGLTRATSQSEQTAVSPPSMPPETKKRKLLTDFFLPSAKTIKTSSPPQEQVVSSTNTIKPSLPPTEQAVPGLSLISDFITPEEEKSLLTFLNHPPCVWRTDLSRKTMHFGGTYCLMPPCPSSASDKHPSQPTPKPQIIHAPPIPPQLSWLIDRMKSNGIYNPGQTPQYCIVNHYTGSLGISAHTENFSFSEPVVGLSLLSNCSMRFHELVEPDGGSVRSGKAQRAKRTGRWVDVMLPGRSLVVMNGDARWKWQHEILRTGRGRWAGWERVSLTLRVKG